MRFEPHQLGQHLRARNNWNGSPLRFNDFGIVITHRGRANDDVRIANIFSIMPFDKLHSHLLEPVGYGRALKISSGNAEAKINQHLSDSGHAYAADANEMNLLNATKHANRSTARSSPPPPPP